MWLSNFKIYMNTKKKEIFKSSRQSCVLTSYTHLLNSLCGSSFSPSEIFNLYNRYFQGLHAEKEVSGEDLIKWVEEKHHNWYVSYPADCEKIKNSYTNKYRVSDYKGTVRELLSSILLHYHCQVLCNDISGYTHLSDFHNYLCAKKDYEKVLKHVQVNNVVTREEPIYIDKIKETLEDSINSAVLFLINGHSIMAKYDGSKYIKINPNYGVEEELQWEGILPNECIIFRHIE